MNDESMLARLTSIRAQIDRAACGRAVTLLAAVKYATAEQINVLHRVGGVNDIGENRVQQLLEHYEKLEDRENVRIHFIGSLQRNKVKYIIDKVCLIQSLDSLPLAEEIERQCKRIGREMDVLVEINSGAEESKGGVLPQDCAAFCEALAAFPHIHLRGFMTMAPKCTDPDDYRKYFSQTLQLCLDIWRKKSDNIKGATIPSDKTDAPIFSMGMSGNFEVAIAEGSTMVRIGSALFRD